MLNLRMIILVGLVATLTLGASACDRVTGKPAPQASPIINPSISEAKTTYFEALKRAKSWQANATLERVYREFNGTLTPSTPAPVTFAFASLVEPTTVFEVQISKDAVRDSKQSKQPFELPMQPIDVGAWDIAPDKALDIAEQAGGQQFREQHLAGYKLLQQLSQVGQYPLQWYFRYDTDDKTRLRYEIWVNAATGAVEQKKQSVP